MKEKDTGMAITDDAYRPPARSERWLWRSCIALGLVGVLTLAAGQYQQLFAAVTGSQSYPARVSLCLPGQAVPTLFSPHIPPSQAADVQYNTTPPTSGPHFSFAPATGIYTAPLPAGLFVHAMEHGHVIIHYPPGTAPATVAALTGLARHYVTEVILMPNPQVASGIVLTAWGRIEHLKTFDVDRITEFITLLSGRYDHGWTRANECVDSGSISLTALAHIRR